MRRVLIPAVLLGIIAVGAAIVTADTKTKYGVTVTADKKTDFAQFKTYMWSSGWPAADKAVHQQIVAAVERELAALGLEKRDAAPADVVVLYAAVRRTDVDLNSKMDEATKMRREYPVGSLAVLMRDPVSGKELLRGRADKVLDLDPARLKEIVDGIVAEMFAKYPTRAKK